MTKIKNIAMTPVIIYALVTSCIGLGEMAIESVKWFKQDILKK